MRNIKTTLRFARNSALLFVAASGVTYLTGCQSENSLNPDNNQIPESALSTAAYSVYGANQGRVTNFGGGSTRAGEYVEATETFTMPDAPAIPADAIDITSSWTDDSNPGWIHDVQYYSNGSPVGGAYKIPAGAELNGGIDAKNGHIDLYVEGKWNPYYIKGDMTVYVLGGTLNYASESMCSEPGITIYNYGAITGKGVTFAGKLYSAVDIDNVGVFGVNEGAELFSKGSIMAKDVRLNGDAVACAFIADKIDIHSVGTIKTSYFEADNLTLNSGNVVLDNNGLVKAKNLFIPNADTRFTVNGTNAVVAGDVMNTNNLTWPKSIFAAEIAIDFSEYQISGSSTKWDGTTYAKNDFEWQVSASNQVVYVPAAGCHGSYGVNPVKPEEPTEDPGQTTDPDPDNGETEDPDPVVPPTTPEDPIVTPELVKIVDIEGLDDEVNHGDHDHGIISATCINFGEDGTAYASYHLRGNGKDANKNENYLGEYAQKGCIEVIKYNEAGVFELGSYMIAPDWDFNHIIVDGNQIVTVGNAKKLGAFIGALPVTFDASEGVKEDFKVKELTTDEVLYGDIEHKDGTVTTGKIGYANAGDGNCVVRQGYYYYVATYEGYGPLNIDFSRVKNEAGDVVFTQTNGSAKHISINGGNMAVIALDSYDKTSSTASVYTFGANDFSFANVLKSYDAVGTVAPVDGKNVVAVDGNDIYACLSQGGLVRVNDGAKFQRGTKVPVNGMAFDDKYVYVANGSFVDVLNKSDLSRVCHYRAASEKSANYIALRNGKIYVAYGEDGIKVFQLVEKEITVE